MQVFILQYIPICMKFGIQLSSHSNKSNIMDTYHYNDMYFYRNSGADDDIRMKGKRMDGR